MNLLKKYPLFFWLLPLYFLFHNYNLLFGFIPLKQLLVFGLVLYLVSTSIYLLFWIVFRNVLFSAVASFLIMGYNLFFGAFHDFLKSATYYAVIGSYTFVIPISVAILIGLILFINKRKTSLLKLTQYLNSLLIVLFIVESVFFIRNTISHSQTKHLIYSHTSLSNHFIAGSIAASSKPDIYFLVYDEYTNNRTLKQLWNYDNSEITTWLGQQGFFVPEKSRANYDFTPFSISSALNMNYLDSNRWKYGSISLSTLQAVKSISNNEVLSILKKEKYQLRFLTPFENEIEDIGATKEFGDIPAKHLYNTLFIYRIQRDILWNFPQNKITDAIRKLFSNKNDNNINKRLKDIYTTIKETKSVAVSPADNPKFVYAHLMITHNPHLFDSSGQVLQNTNMDSIEFFNSYPNQVKYANKTITELVEFIKMNNKRKAVIIIMGDHGFRRLPARMIDYNFPNFCAIYFPDRNYSMLYDTISPVNIFKVVFNTCFHQNFPLSKDISITVNYQ
jgi:hypothetical protein